jgi:hypothetical protein
MKSDKVIGFLFWFCIVMAVVNVMAALVFHDIKFFLWAGTGLFSAWVYRLVLKKGAASGGKS